MKKMKNEIIGETTDIMSIWVTMKKIMEGNRFKVPVKVYKKIILMTHSQTLHTKYYNKNVTEDDVKITKMTEMK